MKLRHLDLFSGIGGFSLGLESAGLVDTVAFCDFDKYCKQVLKKHWEHVPIYNDVKELNYERLKTDGIVSEERGIDIITGGYPCQPFSVAGRKKGEEDPRHVWPEMFRLVQELRPTWVIGENVGGHIKLGLDTVLENLESEGYTARTFSISASSIGANHQRERIWTIAHSNELGRNDRSNYWQGRSVSNDEERNSTEGQSKWSGWFDRIGEIGSVMENTRRSHWPWSEFQGENDYEIGEGDADQFERSSSTSQSNVADSDINGHSQGLTEECYEINTREELQEFWRKSSAKTFGQSDDGGDTKKSRIDENLSRSSISGKTHATQSNGVRGVSTQSNIGQGTVSTDTNKENNDRTLVSEGQSRLRLSKHRGLGDDKETFEGDKIRQGDDNIEEKRMENVADSDTHRSFDEPERNIRGLGKESGRKEETRHQPSVCIETRSSKRSKKMADSESVSSNERELGNSQEENRQERQVGGQTRGGDGDRNVSNREMADSDSERLQGLRQHTSMEGKSREEELTEGSLQEEHGTEMADSDSERGRSGETEWEDAENAWESPRCPIAGWWDVEPNVGRVAHGVPKRVDRLKSLGNSVVPQIPFLIGLAIRRTIENE